MQYGKLAELKFVKNTKVEDKTDMAAIKKKASSGSYETLSAFRSDIDLLLHNCLITNNKKLVAGVWDFINEELSNMKNCQECFTDSTDPVKSSKAITKLCRSPHLIIWAKPQDWCFWPGKVMRAADGSVHVRFFGDYANDVIDPENIMLYSANAPPGTAEDITEALDDAKKVRKTNDHQSLRFHK